ncbi:MAG: VWA domain-containing protein [Prevotellaceae bacterium]|jgi:uncharacterized protein YegL|nr:VWA domain-containing protein [Prevotellaceae bacterium]
MRRLPVYFLIDVSESMIGEPVGLVQDGMASIIKELRTDPYALETVYVSIIVFAGKPQKITSLTELYNFYPPKLPVGGGTSLGKALDFLMNDVSNSVKKTTLEEKGDWKPIIFLFTDGNPTDNFDKSFERWNQKYRRGSNLIVVSIGQDADTNIFGKITDNVLMLNNPDAESFKKFFKWVTASIKTSSVSVSEVNDDELHLAPVGNEDYLTRIDLAKHRPTVKVDENYAVILAKCQTTKQPYLIKYRKRISSGQYGDFAMDVLDYKLAGAYPVDNTYFELSDDTVSNSKINTNSLLGFPACPCCGNQYGFSYCSCGKVLCTGGEKITKCPWCGVEAHFGFCEGNADITRTRG